MKVYWYITIGLCSFVLLLSGLAITILSVNFLNIEVALKWFDSVNIVLAASKYIVATILLIMADYFIIRGERIGVKRGILLWIPFVAFIVFSVVHWGFVGDAYIHFMQRNDRWSGGFSAAVIYMALSYPIAFGISAGNHLLVALYQSRNS